MARLLGRHRADCDRHGRPRGFDLQLTRYDERGLRATFYMTGMEHSSTSATGTGWERTPWRATRRAALAAVMLIRRVGAPTPRDW
jgi:hypothetical protein